MLTPDTTEAESRSRRDAEPTGDCITVTTYLELLAGSIAAAVVFLFALPELIALTNPLGVLSTTALVFTFIFAWFFAWGVIRITQAQLPTPGG